YNDRNIDRSSRGELTMNSQDRTLAIKFAIAILLMASADPAWALRCGNKIIKEGMPEQEVIDLCGEPASVERMGFVLRPYIIKRPAGKPGHHSTGRFYGGYHEELEVVEMLFNFGPHKLMRLIRFEGGRVSYMETAGYGYREKSR
ncbi:MAG: DUF2845 domain-containing protein, partial [Woeseiaceae bacterium]